MIYATLLLALATTSVVVAVMGFVILNLKG